MLNLVNYYIIIIF